MSIDTLGLREQKKRETRQVISDHATQLFLQRGFDRTTIADIAAAARVAKMTVTNYFPRKEDLALDHHEAFVASLAKAVAARRPGESALSAVRRAYGEALDNLDPVIGFTGTEFARMVADSPTLVARLRDLHDQREAALAHELTTIPEGAVPVGAAHEGAAPDGAAPGGSGDLGTPASGEGPGPGGDPIRGAGEADLIRDGADGAPTKSAAVPEGDAPSGGSAVTGEGGPIREGAGGASATGEGSGVGGVSGGEGFVGRVVAAQLAGVSRLLFQESQSRALAGQGPQEIAEALRGMAQQAFDLLEPAIGGYAVR